MLGVRRNATSGLLGDSHACVTRPLPFLALLLVKRTLRPSSLRLWKRQRQLYIAGTLKAYVSILNSKRYLLRLHALPRAMIIYHFWRHSAWKQAVPSYIELGNPNVNCKMENISFNWSLALKFFISFLSFTFDILLLFLFQHFLLIFLHLHFKYAF